LRLVAVDICRIRLKRQQMLAFFACRNAKKAGNFRSKVLWRTGRSASEATVMSKVSARSDRTDRGGSMKKVILSALMALAATAAPAFAADMPVKAAKAPVAAPAPPAFDVAFGAWVGSDYNFRGVSQSNRNWSAGGYVEPQFNTAIGQFYVGTAIARTDWPATGFSDPTAEVDLYGGWRNTWGQISLVLGFIYYYYPGERLGIESEFWEIYGKVAYAVTPDLTLGANIFYTPDLLNYGQFGLGDVRGIYVSGTSKWTTPWKIGEVGSFLSGELGHWFLDNNGGFFIGDASYTYWNAGIGLTWKTLTLDLRYHGTDQSRADCANFLFTTTASSASRWCNDTFIATLKFDTTLSSLTAMK
jgi:uncharacterized protein (TIGR02001 family)